MAPLAMQEFTGIENFTRYVTKNGGVSTAGKNGLNENIAFADSTIFEMLDYPLTKGNHHSFKQVSSAFIMNDLPLNILETQILSGKYSRST